MGNSEQEAAFCFHEQGATARARRQLENNAFEVLDESTAASAETRCSRCTPPSLCAMSLSDSSAPTAPPEDCTDAFEAALVLCRARRAAGEAAVLELRFADVYHYEPWSAALEGKTVLIIHPFEESIRRSTRADARCGSTRGCSPNLSSRR